jgi:hypothetical protein
MPLDQNIEGRHGEREASMEIGPSPVPDLLQMADQRQHRQHRLDEHAVLPFPALTPFEVAGIPLRGMKAGVAQDNHTSIKLLNQPLKGVIRDMGGGTRPPHDQAPLIEQETPFPADNPAMIREAFAANLLTTPAFAHRMDELNPIRVDDTEHGWSGEKACVQS